MEHESKFYIANSLKEKLSSIFDSKDSSTLKHPDHIIYVLGFQSDDNVYYVGVTGNPLDSGFASTQILGFVFLNSVPSQNVIDDRISSINDYRKSGLAIPHFREDKNNRLLLVIYSEDGNMIQKLYDSKTSAFVESKFDYVTKQEIYKNSLIVKLDLYADMSDPSSDKPVNQIMEPSLKFLDDDEEISLSNSNFKIDEAAITKTLTDCLYDHIEPPPEATQMGDYLPQISKKQKAELIKKWRNKVKQSKEPILNFKIDYTKKLVESTGQKLSLDLFIYINLKDTISKTLRILTFNSRKILSLIDDIVQSKHKVCNLKSEDFKSVTFKPKNLDHLIYYAYYMPKSLAQFDELYRIRSNLYASFLLNESHTCLRYSQRIRNLQLTSEDEDKGYLCNLHYSLADQSPTKGGQRHIIKGKCAYRHYMQDRFNDNGWGCAYRSLQTIISWFILNGYICSPDVSPPTPNCVDPARIANGLEGKRLELINKLIKEARPPTHTEIQQVLIDIGDKSDKFLNSKNWIGSQEVCFVLDYLFNIESKILSVNSGGELVSLGRQLCQHFQSQSTPVMIGGGQLAHTIIGCDFNDKNGDISYLVMDPHYTGGEDFQTITKKGWCGWKKNSFWDKNSFYNLCLPQIPKIDC